jgi:hypothetical protein
MCFRDQAAVHVLDRPADDPRAESHYCLACYELKYGNPPTGRIAVPDGPPRPTDTPAYPLSRFTIKGLILACVLFAIVDAAELEFLRSDLVGGTPVQIQRWTARAFLITNPFLAILLVGVVTASWFRDRQLSEIAGGVPRSRWRAIPRLAQWTVAWEEASRLERGLLIACPLWPFTWLFCSRLSLSPRSVFYIASENDFWLVAAALFLILFGVEALLLWGLVASTRRG